MKVTLILLLALFTHNILAQENWVSRAEFPDGSCFSSGILTMTKVNDGYSSPLTCNSYHPNGAPSGYASAHCSIQGGVATNEIIFSKDATCTTDVTVLNDDPCVPYGDGTSNTASYMLQCTTSRSLDIALMPSGSRVQAEFSAPGCKIADLVSLYMVPDDENCLVFVDSYNQSDCKDSAGGSQVSLCGSAFSIAKLFEFDTTAQDQQPGWSALSTFASTNCEQSTGVILDRVFEPYTISSECSAYTPDGVNSGYAKQICWFNGLGQPTNQVLTASDAECSADLTIVANEAQCLESASTSSQMNCFPHSERVLPSVHTNGLGLVAGQASFQYSQCKSQNLYHAEFFPIDDCSTYTPPTDKVDDVNICYNIAKYGKASRVYLCDTIDNILSFLNFTVSN